MDLVAARAKTGAAANTEKEKRRVLRDSDLGFLFAANPSSPRPLARPTLNPAHAGRARPRQKTTAAAAAAAPPAGRRRRARDRGVRVARVSRAQL